ncbi:MAG: hypothetical protein ACRC8S_03170, partial [Fimbriiglobus sp.]
MYPSLQTGDSLSLFDNLCFHRLVRATYQTFGVKAGSIVTFRTAADVIYRYDAEDVIVNRSEVWANVPSARTDLGWEW